MKEQNHTIINNIINYHKYKQLSPLEVVLLYDMMGVMTAISYL